jgi:DNA-binding transcriptional LysR family regulator
MELRQLTTFRTLARTLSFTRTAAELNYVQSNVSAQIQALEGELGVRLFDRLGRQVVLTDAGHRLLDYANRVLELVDEVREVVAEVEEVTGTVAVSAPESLCTYRLPPVLRELRARHPRLRVVFRPGPVADLRQRVLTGEVDVAFLLEEPFSSPALVITPLAREPICLVASPEHPLAQNTQVQPGDLAGQHLLLTERGCSYRALFERRLARSGVRPTITLEFASVEAIKQCAMLDMGIAVLPRVTVAAELDQGRLVALRWIDDFHMLTQAIYHKERGHARGLQALLDTAAQVLGADPTSVPSGA